MKTLILNDKEFDFLKGIIETAVKHREDIRDQNPMLKILETISTTLPKGMLQGEHGSKLAELRAQIEDNEREFNETTLSLKTKFEVASTDN